MGATIAPSNQLENGSWADFVMPAKHSSAAGSSTSALSGELISACNSMPPVFFSSQTIATREGQPAGQVHHQRPERIALGFFGLRVADQQERAQRGDFPEQEQPDQVIGENEAEHRAHEDEQQREEERTPVRNIAVRHGRDIRAYSPARKCRCRRPQCR